MATDGIVSRSAGFAAIIRLRKAGTSRSTLLVQPKRGASPATITSASGSTWLIAAWEAE
jgi:hypothetical protein